MPKLSGDEALIHALLYGTEALIATRPPVAVIDITAVFWDSSHVLKSLSKYYGARSRKVPVHRRLHGRRHMSRYFERGDERGEGYESLAEI